MAAIEHFSCSYEVRRLSNWDSFVNLKTLFHQLVIDMPYMHGVDLLDFLKSRDWQIHSGKKIYMICFL